METNLQVRIHSPPNGLVLGVRTTAPVDRSARAGDPGLIHAENGR
jgi:hypothetical protein